MARGYHDWLVAETAGALKTYAAPITPAVSFVPGDDGLCSLENPAGSSVLLRIQRVFLFVDFVTTGFNFEDAHVLVDRVSAPAGGALVTPSPHDSLDGDSVAVFRRRPTSIGATLANLLGWHHFWFLNTVNLADKAALLYEPLEIYAHFADGRRQPWTLRPTEALLLQVVPADTGLLKFGSLIEYTEEPLG